MSTKQTEAGSPSQAWSSGRVLSTEQRNRKRQVNKESARRLKRDLQDRVVGLERRVDSLELWRTQGASSTIPFPAPPDPSLAQGAPWNTFTQGTWPTDHHGIPYGGHDSLRFSQPSGQIQDDTMDVQAQSRGFELNPEQLFPTFEWSYDRNTHPGSPREIKHMAFENNPASQSSVFNSNLAARHNADGPNNVSIPVSSPHEPNPEPDSLMPAVGISDVSDAAVWNVERAQQLDGSVIPTLTLDAWSPSPSDAAGGNIAPLSPDLLSTLVAPPPIPTAEDWPLKQPLAPNGREITRLCNSMVQYVRSLRPEMVCVDDALNQDVLIRAILHGWDEALASHEVSCALWIVVRNVDSLLFRHCNIKERICILRIIHQMYLYEVFRNTEHREFVPSWYKPRPSQQIIKHEPVVDHFAWPGLRERLTISENNTLTNLYWRSFVRNFRFLSSQSPLELFQHRKDSPYYQFSDEFAESVQDIGRYRMTSDFFVRFPHLRDDIGDAETLSLTTIRLPSFKDPRKKRPEEGDINPTIYKVN